MESQSRKIKLQLSTLYGRMRDSGYSDIHFSIHPDHNLTQEQAEAEVLNTLSKFVEDKEKKPCELVL